MNTDLSRRDRLEALLADAPADFASEARKELDSTLAARSVESAVARLRDRAVVVRIRRTRVVRALLLAAALVVATTAAVAMIERGRRSTHAVRRTAQGQESPPPGPVQQETAAPSVEGPAPAAPETMRVPSAVSAQPPAKASELFARANEERHHGDIGVAVKTYRELQQRFPGSPETRLSRITLGRLVLDRGDAAGALAQFDAYLATGGAGMLREEALVGRALALGRLGRSAEERTAWQALLAAYPNSLSAARARERLR
jgi:TolA-binding protein